MTTASDAALALLKTSGIRLTGPRRTVISALGAAPGHLTVEQLAVGLPHSDLSSIYRCLDLLTRVGAVQQIQPMRGPAVFHLLNGSHAHPHAQCLGCGLILDLETEQLAGVGARLLEGLDFELSDHDVTLAGLCSSCRG